MSGLIFFELSRDRGSPEVTDHDEAIVGAGRVVHEGTSLRLAFSYGFDEPLVRTCTTSRPMAWTMLDALRLIRLVYLQAATGQGDALRFTRGTADGLYTEASEPRGEGEFRVAIGT